MPVIPIPLKASDGDLRLDLQDILSTAYQRANYGATLDYHHPLAPPLRPSDEPWFAELLKQSGSEVSQI